MGAGLGSARAGWKSSAATSSPSGTRRSRSSRSSSRATTSSTSRASCRRPCSRTGRAASTSIQHSAGSGKTNSIAWTAHFLADLHDAQDKKLFDTVLVVSDRNVIDAQLQEAIFDFERHDRRGGDDQGRGRQQERRTGRGALGRQEDRRLHHPDLPLRPGGRAGAGGDAGQALRRDRRRGPQLADRRGGGEAQGGARRRRSWPSWTTAARSAPKTSWRRRWRRGPTTRGITYVAFTATPKTKTLELFGTRPDPTRQAGAGQPARRRSTSTRCGRPSRRSFILDVLQELHALQAGLQAGARGQGAATRRRSSAARR